MGAVHYLRDTLVNFVTGLGTFKDPSQSSNYALNLLNRNQLENAYRSDWIAREIVDAPAEDATREWRDWQASNDQIEAIEEVEKKFKLQLKLKQCMIRARLYGGASLVIGVDDGRDPEDPLDLDGVGEDALKFVVVMNRYELSAGPRIYDVASEWYTRPENYVVQTPMYNFSGKDDGDASGDRARQMTDRDLVRIHPSRVVEFAGNELPDWRLAPMGGGWGDSVLQTADDTLRQWGLTIGGVASMVNDAKMDVIKIPDFSKNIATKEYAQRLLSRFQVANQSKSTINSILLDAEEEWARVQTNFGGLPNLLSELMTVIAGAGRLPVSRLFGKAGAKGLGKSSSGQDELRNYYDGVSSEQRTEITPRLEPLDQVLVRSALGRYDPNVHYAWSPLYTPEPKELADIAKTKAETTQIYVTSGLFNEDVIRDAAANQMIEDKVYPGLEDAIDEHGAEPEVVEARAWSPGYDPVTGKPLAAAAPKPGIPGGPPKQIAPPTKDADDEPRDDHGRWTGGGAKPTSPHETDTNKFVHAGRADLKAQGLKSKGRGSANTQHETALVTWRHAENTKGPATAVIGGRGWQILGKSDRVSLSQPHMVVTPEGVLHAYNPRPITSDCFVDDAVPRTLYVRRDVLNGDAIVAWAKAQGFPTTVPADDMHVTVAFSRQPVDWMKVPEAYYGGQRVDADGDQLVVPPSSVRMVDGLGDDKKAIVLMFNSSALAARHEQIRMEAGASWDWPEYQPHVTITFDVGNFDWRSVKPYRGEIVLGPEVFEECKEDESWRSTFQEDADDEPRDDHGRWTGSQAERIEQAKRVPWTEARDVSGRVMKDVTGVPVRNVDPKLFGLQRTDKKFYAPAGTNFNSLAKYPTRDVPIDKLRTNQGVLDLDGIIKTMDYGAQKLAKQTITTVERSGEFYIVDGNHRSAALHALGGKTIRAKVIPARGDIKDSVDVDVLMMIRDYSPDQPRGPKGHWETSHESYCGHDVFTVTNKAAGIKQYHVAKNGKHMGVAHSPAEARAKVDEYARHVKDAGAALVDPRDPWSADNTSGAASGGTVARAAPRRRRKKGS